MTKKLNKIRFYDGDGFVSGKVSYFQDGPRRWREYFGGSYTGNSGSWNTGGIIPGVGNRDTVSAMLTPGEFVVRKEYSKQFRDILEQINHGYIDVNSLRFPQYNTQSSPRISPRADGPSNMYNEYNMSFTINGSDLNENQLADILMTKIQRAENSKIRSYRY